MEYRIDITPARRWNGSAWVGQGSSFAAYEGQRIGEFRIPSCDAARWLKDNVGAQDTDTLVTLRDDVPCILGSIGWLAERAVEENDRVSPRWAKYRPYRVASSDEARFALDAHVAPRGSTVTSQTAEIEAEVLS